jgi:lipoic acid synthetase
LEEFASIKEEGMKMGFKHVESGPLVRSSYHAKNHVENITCGTHAPASPS